MRFICMLIFNCLNANGKLYITGEGVIYPVSHGVFSMPKAGWGINLVWLPPVALFALFCPWSVIRQNLRCDTENGRVIRYACGIWMGLFREFSCICLKHVAAYHLSMYGPLFFHAMRSIYLLLRLSVYVSSLYS